MIRKEIPAHSAHRKGFTLTEIAIVLGIMGLILGGIWTAASSVYSNQRSSRAQTATIQIVQGVRALFASQSATGVAANTFLTPQLVNAGVIPKDLPLTAAGANDVTGPFPSGRAAVIADATGNGFTIVMTAVPRENCINLLSSIAGTNRDPGLYSARAENTALPALPDAVAVVGVITQPLSPINAGNAVNVGPANPGGVGGCVLPLNKVRMAFTLK